MKKKILITMIIIVILIIAVFLMIFIRERKDAETKFLLDNENKYVLKYISYPTEGGFASSSYYCEIDLNNKYIDCRYDFEYWFPDRVSFLERLMMEKTRKLKKRYKLTDSEVVTLNECLKKNINTPEENIDEEKDENIPEFNYYILENENGYITIKNSEHKTELKQILKNINENLYKFLLKG